MKLFLFNHFEVIRTIVITTTSFLSLGIEQIHLHTKAWNSQAQSKLISMIQISTFQDGSDPRGSSVVARLEYLSINRSEPNKCCEYDAVSKVDGAFLPSLLPLRGESLGSADSIRVLSECHAFLAVLQLSTVGHLSHSNRGQKAEDYTTPVGVPMCKEVVWKMPN